ncbi:MAG TPA: YdeI/OmpD-associated family protein [Pedobacter sp.]|nr:YdeI/OmpD-associated family protein [Pedobacter sp.]
MKHTFKAKIYTIGINWAVDVPREISEKMLPEKGYIRIKGQINHFDFIQTLVPVKNAPYRLFVNFIMMKGGKTAVGEIASFEIEQNHTHVDKIYPMPKLLADTLEYHQLTDDFNQLTPTRIKDILKYLFYVKTEETLKKNIDKVVTQLKNKEKNTRIP